MKKTGEDYLVRISKESAKILDDLSLSSNMPKSKILNIMIAKNANEKNKEMDFLPSNEDKNETIIKIKITKSERDFLEAQALKSGAKSLTSEIKYRLLNTIHKNKFFTSNEYEDLYKTRSELSMIGRNLNQILKRLNRPINSDVEDQEIILVASELNTKLDDLKDGLKNIMKHTEQRF